MLGKWIDSIEVYPIFVIEDKQMSGKDNVPLAISEEKFEEYKRITDEFWIFQDELKKIYDGSI